MDIFLTEGNDRKSYSSIILKNGPIRPIDAQPISPEVLAKEDPKTPHAITIEVPQQQALALNQLRERGGSFGIILHGNLAAE